jgi:sarcosine oxidase
MFTNTPDHHFVIDLHPDYQQVSIASPCSGHGFKFASVVGEIMADLAEKGFTRHDISLFRLDRLTGERRAGQNGLKPGRDGRAEQHGRLRSFPRAEDVRTFW